MATNGWMEPIGLSLVRGHNNYYPQSSTELAKLFTLPRVNNHVQLMIVVACTCIKLILLHVHVLVLLKGT